MNRSDNFDRTHGTSLGTPSDGGSAWVTPVGTWAIDNPGGTDGAAYTSAAIAHAHAYLESNAADVEVAATMAAIDSGGGLIARWVDASNYLALFVVEGHIRLQRITAGEYTTLLGFTGSQTAPSDYAIRCDGDQISIKKDGVTVLGPVTETQGQSATKHGMACYNETASRLDDFAITDLAPADVTAPTASDWATDADGDTITGTLSESGCVPASGTGGFTLAGTDAEVTGWTIAGTTITLALDPPVEPGEAVTIAYSSASASEPIEDAAGNPLADFSGVAVANNVPDPPDPLVAPVLSEDSHTATSATFTWPAATGGSPPYAYQLQQAPDDGGSPGAWADADGATTSPALVLGLDPETPYHFRLAVTDDDGSTATSNVVAITTDAASGGGGGDATLANQALILGELAGLGDAVAGLASDVAGLASDVAGLAATLAAIRAKTDELSFGASGALEADVVSQSGEPLVRTLRAGSTTTSLVLAADEPARDGALAGWTAWLADGAGASQLALVTAYDGDTQTATVVDAATGGPLAEAPDETTTYQLLPPGALAPVAAASVAEQVLVLDMAAVQDSAPEHSLCGLVLLGLEWEVSPDGTTLTIRKAGGGGGAFATRTLARVPAAGAEIITGVE